MGYDETATAVTTAEDIESELRAIAGPLLGRSDVSAERDLFDQGATSLSFVRLLVEVKRRFDVTVNPVALDGDASLERLATTIHKVLTERAS
jgi:acyl carrier protein